MKRQTSFIFIFFLICGYRSYAQDDTDNTSWISKHPIEISAGTHAIGLPFRHLLSGPYYPELNIGLQSTLMDRNKVNLNVVNGVGLASHPFNGNRYSLNTYVRFKYKFPLNIYSQIGLGVAYTILTPPNESYELSDDGVYQETRGLETEWYSGVNIETGYHITAVRRINLDAFFRYSAGINFFHHPQIPVFPYTSTQIGLRFYFQK